VPEITVERLTKRYGETLAVDDLSFTVDAGRVTGFLGPNGSGKSTTLRALLGLIRPTSGRALVLGKPFHELSNPVRTVGASLDASDVHPGRTGRSHLRTLAAAAGLPNSRVDEVLDMTELTPARDRRVKGYSMGMRQRLALAAALLGDPRILMLDEPANGLDPQGMRWLRDILVALAAEGRAVLISSHVLSEVEQTVDSVVVIGVGRLVMQGTLQDLVAGDTRPALVRSPRMDELRALLEAAGASARPDGRADTMLVHGVSLEEIGTIAAEHGIAVFELTRAVATLEDRFLELTGESGNVR
jgi:ABC-2 type transport system ATP-binding protein